MALIVGSELVQLILQKFLIVSLTGLIPGIIQQ